MTQHLPKLTFTISASSTTSVNFAVISAWWEYKPIKDNLEVTTTPTTHTINWGNNWSVITMIQFSINDLNIPVTLTNVILHSA